MSDHQNKIDQLKQKSFTGKFKFLLNDALVYGIAGALSKFLAIFLVPILTRILTKEEFGLVDAITVMTSVFTIISIFGMDSAVARYFYDTENEEERKETVSIGFFLQIFLSSITCILVYLYSEELSLKYLNTAVYAELIEISSGIIFSSVFFLFFQLILKWTFQRNIFLFIALGNILMTFALTFLLVIYFDFGVKGVFYARLSSTFLFAVLGLIYSRKFITIKIVNVGVKRFFVFATPILAITLIPALIPGLERYFVIKYLSSDYLGEYAIGIRLASLIALVAIAFSNVWKPFSIALHKEKDANDLYKKMGVIYCIIMIIIGLIIIGFAKPIIMLLAPENFHNAIYLVLPLTFSSIILFVNKTFLQLGITLSKKTYFSLIAYLINIGITSGLLYSFVEKWRLIGITYAVLLSTFILAITLTYFSYKVYHIRYDLKKMLLIITTGYLFGFGLQQFYELNILFQLFINSTIIFLFILFVFYIILDKREQILIIDFVRKKIQTKH